MGIKSGGMIKRLRETPQEDRSAHSIIVKFRRRG